MVVVVVVAVVVVGVATHLLFLISYLCCLHPVPSP